MALERERRFLVNHFMFNENQKKDHIVQMYIVDRRDHSVRIRIINDEKAEICYKYYLSDSEKEEHEFPLDLKIARQIHDEGSYESIVIKTRYYKDGWEVDIYSNKLGVAEFEYSNDSEFPTELPYWIGAEVTGVYEYTNVGLARKFKNNKKTERRLI